MMTEIGHLTAAVIPEPAEMIEAAIGVVSALRRGPEQHVPIKFGRRIAVRRLANARHDVAEEITLDADNFADGVVAQKVFGLVIMFGGTLLRADLDDAFVLRCDL